jgi:hypothetical protein
MNPYQGDAMFNPLKNSAVQISFVNTKKPNTDTPAPETQTQDTAEIVQIATDAAVKVIGAIGVAFAANQVLKSVLDVAVFAAKAKLK